MKFTKKVTITTDAIDKILCNKCGGMCTTESQEKSLAEGRESERYWYGLIEVSFTAGWHSVDFDDSDTYTFSLCEKCLSVLFASFAIQPVKTGIYSYGDESS